MEKVDQITSGGIVVSDYDQKRTKKQQRELLKKYFPQIESMRGGFSIKYKGNPYCLLVKNITYLGHPWPGFKKRIQVPTYWNKYRDDQNIFIMGIYSYKNVELFVFFDKKIRGKNSAAHVSSIDLLKGWESGIFHKEDKNGNHIVVCTGKYFVEVFEKISSEKIIDNSPEIRTLHEFFLSLDTTWDGIIAYKEMINDRYENCFLGEWPGWYLEFLFQKFIRKNPSHRMYCKYTKRKKEGEYDFDLEFPRGKHVGDLKTHAHNSSAILGNDKKSFLSAIQDFGRIWYVVFDMQYTKDRDFGCEVSHYWNQQINRIQKREKPLSSYCSRMKKNGILQSLRILEFNQYNIQYISDFLQGRQRNGARRQPKILIKRGNIDNFVIFRAKKME